MIFKSDDPEAIAAELAAMSPEHAQGLRDLFDRHVARLNHYAMTGELPRDEPESEAVDADGLNASERKACTASGCSAAEFLQMKAAFAGTKP